MEALGTTRGAPRALAEARQPRLERRRDPRRAGPGRAARHRRRQPLRAGRRGVGAPRGHGAAGIRAQFPGPGGARRRGDDDRGRGLRVARRELRVSGAPDPRVGAGAAARDARLRDRLRVHRRAAVRRPRAVGAARRLRVGRRRVLVPGDPLAARRRRDVRGRALSVRVPPRARGLPRAVAVARRGRPHPGPARVASLLPREPAPRATGHRRRRRARLHGDAGGLRHRLLLRRADLHHRHLPGLAVDGRAGRRGEALDDAARVRRGPPRRRAAGPAARALPRFAHAAPPRPRGARPRAGRGRARGLPRAAGGRLRDPRGHPREARPPGRRRAIRRPVRHARGQQCPAGPASRPRSPWRSPS